MNVGRLCLALALLVGSADATPGQERPPQQILRRLVFLLVVSTSATSNGRLSRRDASLLPANARKPGPTLPMTRWTGS